MVKIASDCGSISPVGNLFEKMPRLTKLFIFFETAFLPPAYVVRGKVIFILGNVCLFTLRGGGGGYPLTILSGIKFYFINLKLNLLLNCIFPDKLFVI